MTAKDRALLKELEPTFETVVLPFGALETIDRLRGEQSRSDWLEEAALRLARQQAGHDPQDPIGWYDLGPGLSVPRLHVVTRS